MENKFNWWDKLESSYGKQTEDLKIPVTQIEIVSKEKQRIKAMER